MQHRPKALVRAVILVICGSLLIAFSACSRGGHLGREYVYVSAPQVNLRDRLSAVYNKVAVVTNGERLQVLEKSKRFYRVRTHAGAEGWIELRYLVTEDIFDGFEKLKKDNSSTSAQAHGLARADLNIHLTPSRDGEHLYQLKEGEKVEVLKRTITEKQQQPAGTLKPSPKPAQKAPAVKTAADTAQPAAASPEIPKVYEDWSLVRDSQKRVGWVLARMIDIDVPFEIAQYAEGQRIVATFVLSTVTDIDPTTNQPRSVPQYLMVTTEPKDGQPFDFNGLRVFSWNLSRHRYETAYRERDLFGVFPISVGHEVFDREGDLPSFTVHEKDANGNMIDRKYKMNGLIVRRVMSPAEEAADKAEKAQKAAQRKADRDAAKQKRKRH